MFEADSSRELDTRIEVGIKINPEQMVSRQLTETISKTSMNPKTPRVMFSFFLSSLSRPSYPGLVFLMNFI